MACHTFSGVQGMSMWVTPKGARASMMAFCTAGGAAMVPLSVNQGVPPIRRAGRLTGMSQKRRPKGSRQGGQFAPKQRANAIPLDHPVDLSKQADEQVATTNSDGSALGPAWMEISDTKRQELMEEADRYLDELVSEFGEPSLEDEVRAKAFVEGIRRAGAANSGA